MPNFYFPAFLEIDYGISRCTRKRDRSVTRQLSAKLNGESKKKKKKKVELALNTATLTLYLCANRGGCINFDGARKFFRMKINEESREIPGVHFSLVPQQQICRRGRFTWSSSPGILVARVATFKLDEISRRLSRMSEPRRVLQLQKSDGNEFVDFFSFGPATCRYQNFVCVSHRCSEPDENILTAVFFFITTPPPAGDERN